MPDLNQVVREEGGKVVALLFGEFGDLDLAQDALQDAIERALPYWQQHGVPRNPAAWLLVTARRRALDVVRRKNTYDRLLTRHAAELAAPDELPAIDTTSVELPDERLRLVFLCCHPSLSVASQIALTLRLVGGLTTVEIASAFLISEPTVFQRITRAKQKVREARIPFGIPRDELLAERLVGVRAVLYLIFNEGYLPSTSAVAARPDLADEAIRLTRLLDERLPNEPETIGLLALMLLTEARRPARIDNDGELVLLDDQDRRLWTSALIDEGKELVERALRMSHPGPYQVQAAIAAVHDESRTPNATDWHQIELLYRELYRMTPTSVVALNHAIAVAMTGRVADALSKLDELNDLSDRHLFHSVRANFLRKLGRTDEANNEYARAIELVTNDAERRLLLRLRQT